MTEVVEPSDAERAALPECSATYMEALEAENEQLRETLRKTADALSNLIDDIIRDVNAGVRTDPNRAGDAYLIRLEIKASLEEEREEDHD